MSFRAVSTQTVLLRNKTVDDYAAELVAMIRHPKPTDNVNRAIERFEDAYHVERENIARPLVQPSKRRYIRRAGLTKAELQISV